MLLKPEDLQRNLDRLEEIEKTTLRLVTQAIYNYRETAFEIFHQEVDLVSDIGEDITREALDRLGMPKIDQRLFGDDALAADVLYVPNHARQSVAVVILA